MLTLLLMGILTLAFSVQPVRSDYVFYDDFDGGLVQWNNFGYPTPATFQDPSFEDGWGYSTEGDANYGSGSWSKQLIDISNGIVVEFRVKQEAGNVWDMFYVIGVGSWQSGYGDYEHWSYYFGVSILGHNPDGNAEGTDDIVYLAGQRDVGPVSEYREDGANDHQFHVFRIVYDGLTNDVEFYRDDDLVVTLNAGPRPYDELPLLIVGRDYHDTNYLDWIRVSSLQKPEHDIAVTDLQVPKFLKPGESALVNATIENKGLSDEIDINVNFLVNDTLVGNVVIPSLENGTSRKVSFAWTAPTIEGNYNITIYAPPVPGENITTNNLAMKIVKVIAVTTYKLSYIPRRMHGDENYIYYTTQNGGTYRINKVTGVEEFFCDKGHDLIWVEGDYVYVGEGYELRGSGTNDIYKYDKNGNLIWHVHPTYEGPWGGATFQFGVGKYYIYAVAGPYAYGAISKEDGSIVWVSEGGVTRYPDMVMADLKNEVLIECGWWSTNTIQRTSKVDGHIIWQRKGPTEEMGETTRPVDITDDAVWIQWFKGTYPNHYFYALAKWDRNTGALIEAFPDKPYRYIWHVGPEGSLIFKYPDEAGNALVWNYLTQELCKVNTQTWEIYWSTDLGFPMQYCENRIFIDGEYIYLRDITDPTIIYQYPWTTAPPPPAGPVLNATVDINPHALNLRSRGRWITTYIELPEGYDVGNINVTSIMLNDTIPVYLMDVPAPKPVPTAIGDYDGDGIPDLMVKFNRAELTSYILTNADIVKLFKERFMTITLTITGKLNDGTPFQGSTTVRLIMPMPRSWRFMKLWKYSQYNPHFSNKPTKAKFQFLTRRTLSVARLMLSAYSMNTSVEVRFHPFQGSKRLRRGSPF